MRIDELGFFNQQLAAMLRERIPLESALNQLSSGMAESEFRSEIQVLESDLSRGFSLQEALAKRRLPEFYKEMLLAGAKSNDLPGMLTLLADHYNRAYTLALRLKGLMVYPVIVIVVALLLALLIGTLFLKLLETTSGVVNPPSKDYVLLMTWLSPSLLAVAAVAIVSMITFPRLRNWARWRLPAFREASIAQLASSMAVMLKAGTSLSETLSLAEKLEAGTPAASALANWKSQIALGQGKLDEWRDPSRTLPPLLLWLVKSSPGDPAAGFAKAAALYNTRSAYRTELLLYGALPVSVLLLGQMIVWQAAPLLHTLLWFMNAIGDVGI